MNKGHSRSNLEADLAQALSRHIGYTSAAFDLERIVSVLDYFENSPSMYEPEIVSKLVEADPEGGANSNYLSEVINFSVSMQIVEPVGLRSAQLQKYAPTARGRVLAAAKSLGDNEFYNYVLTKTVLLADSDSIFCVVDYFCGDHKIKLIPFFKEFHEVLRRNRLQWLFEAIPERVLFQRVADQVSWLKPSRDTKVRYNIAEISENTARHHSTPRKGWIEHLGMLDESTSQLTVFGEAVHRSLTSGGDYFWLGPASTTQDVLKIEKSKQIDAPSADTFRIGGENTEPTRAQLTELVDSTFEVMSAGYQAAKLVHAPQATLELPIEFIDYRSCVDGKSYSWRETLDEVFKRHRSKVQRLSARVGEIGFYKKI